MFCVRWATLPTFATTTCPHLRRLFVSYFYLFSCGLIDIVAVLVAFSFFSSSCGSPQAAFYILQHSKTMSLRFRQQCQTAQAVAEMLEAHEKVCTLGGAL